MPDNPVNEQQSMRIMAADTDCQAQALACAARWQFTYCEQVNSGLVLVQQPNRLELQWRDQPKMGAVYVDFASDALAYRRKQRSIKSEAIARACGVKGGQPLQVLDATAGLGRDAFVLASFGCQVKMIERSSIVAALLDDGLKRAAQDAELASWLPSRMTLLHGKSSVLLGQWQAAKPEVIYLDPMFPHRSKSALVKKEMRLFQQLLGPDMDADALLAPALALASKRVVVKRPDSAPPLAGKVPSMTISSKKHRFDVYLIQG